MSFNKKGFENIELFGYLITYFDAILPRRSITRAMTRRLQEDWARDGGEGPKVLMSLKVDFGPMG